MEAELGLLIELAMQFFFVCLFVCFLFFCFVFFRDRVSLCSPGCPGTHSVDQACLKLRNLPASASQVLGLKACATIARLKKCTTYKEIQAKIFFWALSA